MRGGPRIGWGEDLLETTRTGVLVCHDDLLFMNNELFTIINIY